MCRRVTIQALLNGKTTQQEKRFTSVVDNCFFPLSLPE